MDLRILSQNIEHAREICPTWYDRLTYLSTVYMRKPTRLKFRPEPQISFRYPAPVSDLKLVVRRNLGADAIIFNEVFDRRNYDFHLPFSPRTIVDVGANAGFATVFLARKYPRARIIAVEPVQSNLETLRKNAELNRVNVDVVPSAIAVTDGEVLMDVSGLAFEHRIVDKVSERAHTLQVTRVGAMSMPTLMQQFRLDRIGLLKIDIEGYEKRLLTENCEWLRLVDAICLEIHDGYTGDNLVSLAVEYGFSPPIKLPAIWLLVREGSPR